jgi:hypothetical protein
MRRQLIIAGSEGGCSIPMGATDFDSVFGAAKRFPGFKDEGFSDAEAGAPYVCWRKTIGDELA